MILNETGRWVCPDIFTCRIRVAVYEGVSKSFRTGGLERELLMVELSAFSADVSLFVESVS
jgi:hypothetical protein